MTVMTLATAASAGRCRAPMQGTRRTAVSVVRRAGSLTVSPGGGSRGGVVAAPSRVRAAAVRAVSRPSSSSSSSPPSSSSSTSGDEANVASHLRRRTDACLPVAAADLEFSVVTDAAEANARASTRAASFTTAAAVAMVGRCRLTGQNPC